MATAAKYCPIRGKPGREAFDRFGEWACSDEHAEAHVQEVRSERRRATARHADRDEPDRERFSSWFPGGRGRRSC